MGTAVVNGSITGNFISGIYNYNTGGYASRGLILNSGSATSNIIVANNMISNIAATSDVAINWWNGGIDLEGTMGGVQIYDNTVALTGSFAGYTSGSGSAALMINSGVTHINVRNNIFINTYDNTTVTTDKGWAIYSAAPATAYDTIDYNDYYAASPDVLGYLGGDRTTLAAIQTAFGGNTHSVNFSPLFVSATDFHLQPVGANAPLYAGQPLTSVTTDIDGTTRGLVTTIIGAHEAALPVCNTIVGGTATPITPSLCVSGTTTISLTGATAAIGIGVQWYSSADSITFTPIAGATSTSYTIAPAITATTYYRAISTCSFTLNSDSASTSVHVYALPTVAVTPTAGGFCSGSGGSVALTASGASTYTWTPSAGLSATTGASVTASPANTSTYVVSGTDLHGCVNTASAVVTVTLTPTTPVFTPAPAALCAGSSIAITGLSSTPASVAMATGSISVSVPDADANGIQNPLMVTGIPAGAVITSVAVNFDLTHTFDGDMNFNITAPNGSTLNLVNRRGSLNDNFTGTIVSSAGVTPFTSGTAPYTGTFAADAATGVGPTLFPSNVTTWPALYSVPNGTWSLGMNDVASGDLGVLLDWGITINYSYPTIPSWTPAAGLYTDAGLTTPYVAGTTAGTLYAAPSATTVYTATSSNGTCTTSANDTITVNPLPLVYAVTGGAHYCAGGTGVAVGVANSETGVNYQLFNGTTAVGTAVAGTTGSAVSFGLQTVAGTYTVVATNATTGCTSNMTGTATVTIDPLPIAYTVTGGGFYCAGGTGVAVGVANSETGVNYQLFNGATALGTAVAGTTGSAVSFGLQTAAGSYTVQATNASTTCTNPMTGSVTITINPLPTAFTVTGGGNYCAGGTGVAVGLGNSDLGFSYQLYNGATAVGAPVAGTGSAISFGLQTGAGTYTVTSTNTGTTCTSTMTGSATITIDPLPTAFAVTGGGSYCIGGTGVVIGLANSTTGVSYQLFNGATAVGTAVAGTTGSAISFGLQTAAGTYTVQATNGTTTCTNTMTGSVTVTINPLPTAFAVTGGGGYCPGGTGVVVGLFTSTTGVNYQLFVGTTAVGAPVAGTGSAISFGLQTTVGTYTVVATNTTTSCTNNMTGSVTVSINPVPLVYNVTGGGSYCAGGTGVAIDLSNSETGVNYQLYNGSTPVGTAVAGTGAAFSFGLQTAAGTYAVVATNATTGCTSNMSGFPTITITPLPTAYTVTGGGSYCTGGTGVVIGLSNTTTGVNYQLYNGTTAVGSPVAGTTGSAISFGLQTAAGTYTVQATDGTSTCVTTMTGAATITINPLPTAYAVTGGGAYCAGGSGIAVGLLNSTAGVSYQLYNGASTVGTAVAGTGGAISFGLQTAAGTYTVVATNTTTSCTNNMTGSVSITINPLPTAYTVTGGGGYCTGGTGMAIGLANSETGVTYQLFNGATAVGTPVAGTTGSSISFGLQTAAGTYNVVATNTGTSCTSSMTGTVTITINPLPTAFVVTGGGSYCTGGAGVAVGLFNSTTGVSYQLYNGATAVGTPVPGTGSAISFGLQTAAGTYTVVATNTTTSCTSNMTGSVTITISPLPIATYTVTGGGSYCAAGTGVAVGLSNSETGVNYQLYVGTTAVGTPVAGTGAAISFGLQTAAGTYTVVATNATTACTSNMTGSVTITIIPLPTTYTVTGGGAYCTGGTGVIVGLSNSETGITYQLYNGTTAVGTPVSGTTGSAISFGLQTAAGTYTVVANNSVTTCSVTMTGSATITINALPTAYAVTGGGAYCAGGTGVVVGLFNSTTGVTYQLYNGITAVGAPVTGTGAAISFGLQTAAGTYTVVATNTTTTCTSNMTGSVTITINPLPVSTYTVTGGGAYCSGGTGAVVGLSNSDAGINYQLYVGTSSAGVAVAGTGAAISFGLQTAAGTYTVVATDAITGCTSNMTGSVAITVTTPVTVSVTLSAGVSDTVCLGSTVTITATPVNGGTTPSYVWSVNGVAVTATGATYSYVPTSGDIVSTVLTSSAACVVSPTATDSITITTAANVTPLVNITASPDTSVCVGTAITFTATPTFGGTAPTYSWIVNGTVVGVGTTYTYIPGDGDVVVALMHSNFPCRTIDSAFSNAFTIEVNPVVTPLVTITATPGTTILVGANDTLTAGVISGGTTPTYQWYVNGVAISGATNATYISTFTDNDSVSVVVASSLPCASVASNHVIIHVTNDVKDVTVGNAHISLMPNPNNGTFNVKGILGTSADENVSIEVTDMLGQIVYRQQVIVRNGEVNEMVQLDGIVANGTYLLNFRSGTHNAQFHFILNR